MTIPEIALGALLHDIGKFSQRAHCGNEGLSPQSLGMESSICPTDWTSKRPTHRHVLYTNEFVENLPFLPEGLDKSRVANLASYHHRPDSSGQKIVSEADCLSSGMERYETDGEESLAGRRFRRVRLQSVASTVFPSAANAVVPAVFSLTPLTPQDAFPLGSNTNDDLTDQYQALWRRFLPAWAENQCNDPVGYVNRAMSILERYTWCIPSATNTVPDISLFDHLKTTAAIAVCLFAAGETLKEPFLLVAADLTGIQRYIFDVRQGTGGLARRLRARSFKVAAYTESISISLLGRLGLPLTQRILFAGGKFHLLLPNSANVRDQLNAVKREVARWLFDNSSGEVGLAMEAIPLGQVGLENFSDSVSRLNARLREARDRAGEGVLFQSGTWEPSEFVLPELTLSEGQELCECCRLKSAPEREHHDDVAYICDDCFAEEQVGRRLPSARYVVFYPDGSGRNRAPIGSFELLDSKTQPHGMAQLLVDLEGESQGDSRWSITGAFRGRHIPHDPVTGDAVTFADLARKSTGREALACLKMDVDNLGYLFSQGLKDRTPEAKEPDGWRDRASISRVATLSRTLDVFFAGHLEALLRAEFDDVYLLYSGGDDLAAVGPWNRIFDLTLRIRDDVRRFTGGNPAWSLSAGIAVVNPRVPVLLVVEEAEKLLGASKTIGGSGVEPWPLPKNKPRGEPQKGRITALGTSIPWSQYGEVLNQARRLLGWLQDETLRTAQVRRLLHFAEMAREYQHTHDTNYLQYAPLLVRELRRNWQGANQREAREWAAQLTVIESETMKSARFICEYALYGNRTQKREDV